MINYSTGSRTRKYVKGYEFLSFRKNLFNLTYTDKNY